ncbi:hypothetical protein [Yoonia sp. I 8.24]|uniref:hypothetical protein n=1 Tax=Yoonia sp. I 8.24 TaxID=1537229 RepID=UPI001EE0C2AE|nr:hypothetical protein [Yoonia sp. I 8.24]MCG3266415.1 hypothetical protein [Yoonia sp. I 8.24]
MNAFFHRWMLASVLIWAAFAAHANCGVIDTLDKLHSVETRLMRNPNSPLYSSEIRYLSNQARQLSGASVTDGLQAGPSTDKGAAFLYFIYYAKKLALEVSIDEPATATRILQHPAVSANHTSVGVYLGDMRCSAAEIAGAAPFPIVTSDQIDIEFLVARSVVTSVFTLRHILIAIALSAALLVWLQFRNPHRAANPRSNRS